MGSNRGVATFFDVETFSTIQEGFLTPYDLPHYDPNQIFNSLRDGGISKRNYLETQEELEKRFMCNSCTKGREEREGACTPIMDKSIGPPRHGVLLYL